MVLHVQGLRDDSMHLKERDALGAHKLDEFRLDGGLVGVKIPPLVFHSKREGVVADLDLGHFPPFDGVKEL